MEQHQDSRGSKQNIRFHQHSFYPLLRSLLTVVTADLVKGSGTFNFLQGAVQSSMGLGGVLSNSLFGWVTRAIGFNVSFIGLSLVALAGGVLYGFKMPETKQRAENPEPRTANIA
jgi:hypothetical protein